MAGSGQQPAIAGVRQVETGKKRTPFSSHLSAGLLTTSVAAVICFGTTRSPVMVAWPWAWALVGLTHGIAGRSIPHCLYGLCVSAACVFLANLGPSGLQGMRPGPYVGFQIFLCVCALWGAVAVLWRTDLGHAGWAGLFGGTVLVIVLALAYSRAFPGRIMELERWQLLTLLSAIPVLNLCTWLPVDHILKMTDRKPG